MPSDCRRTALAQYVSCLSPPAGSAKVTESVGNRTSIEAALSTLQQVFPRFAARELTPFIRRAIGPRCARLRCHRVQYSVLSAT